MSIPNNAPTTDQHRSRDFDTRLVVARVGTGIILAIVVVSLVSLFADVGDLRHSLDSFNWWLTIPALLLTCWNYGLRFINWQVYLRLVNAAGMSRTTSALVFLSAFSMSITLGKVGEIVKATRVKQLTGTPIATTTGVIAAERLTDGLAMLILASIGAFQFTAARPFIVGLTVGMVALLVLVNRSQRFVEVVRSKLGRSANSLIERVAVPLFTAMRLLLAARPLVRATSLGVAAWLGECTAFFLVLIGLGVEPSPTLFLVATFSLAVSSLAGAASLLPGGLGVAEASLAAMLLLLVPDDGITKSGAAAATLLIRFGTLWFSVIVGIGAIALLWKRSPDRVRSTTSVEPLTPGVHSSEGSEVQG